MVGLLANVCTILSATDLLIGAQIHINEPNLMLSDFIHSTKENIGNNSNNTKYKRYKKHYMVSIVY